MYSCEDFVNKEISALLYWIDSQTDLDLFEKKKDIFINDQQKPTIRVSFKNV